MKKRILLVDDKLSFYRNFSHGFKDQFDLTYCATKSAALLKLKKQNSFDLLLIDLKLDDNSIELQGLELIQQIRKTRYSIPIIAISKYLNDPAIRKDSLDAGADKALPKSSFDIPKWSKIFNNAISKYQVDLKAI